MRIFQVHERGVRAGLGEGKTVDMARFEKSPR
jgi:hypothetical protein